MLHMLKHSATKPFACDFCEYSTKYPAALQRHKTIKHPSKQEDEDGSGTVDSAFYKCSQCEFKTRFKWNLSAHKRKHMPEKEHKCLECSYVTSYRHNLIKHQRQHNNALFKCDKCTFTTKFEGHIYRHMSKIHNELMYEGHKCSFCDFCTIVKWRLNIHLQRSKQSEALKCDFCGFETMYLCESKRHKRNHFDDTQKDEIDANTHLESVRESTTPPECSGRQVPVASFEAEPPAEPKEINYTDDHQKSNHYTVDPNSVNWNNIQVLESNDGVRSFQCHMCDYTSKFKAAVQRHFQRRHTDKLNRPYKCSNCDFATKTKDQIALHNKRSQSSQRVHCSQCKFSTLFKCQLVMHQKTHNEYKCNVCVYSCKSKYDLDNHFSTQHLGKHFKCKFCEYKAARRHSLVSHEATHTGNKPLKCPHCDYRTVRNCFLMNHLNKKHSDLVRRALEKHKPHSIERPTVPVKECGEQKEMPFEDISVVINNIKNNVFKSNFTE